MILPLLTAVTDGSLLFDYVAVTTNQSSSSSSRCQGNQTLLPVFVCVRVCFRNLPHPEPYDMKALLYFIKGASYSHNKELKLKNQGKTCGRRDSWMKWNGTGVYTNIPIQWRQGSLSCNTCYWRTRAALCFAIEGLASINSSDGISGAF